MDSKTTRRHSVQYALFVCTLFFLSSIVRVQLVQAGSEESASTAQLAPSDLGVSFIEGSTSQIIVKNNGKRYLIDLATHSIREAGAANPITTAGISSNVSTQQNQGTPSGGQTPAVAENKPNPNAYKMGDDLVFSVPTGRRLERHGFYFNFTHRFPYSAAFSGPARGAILDGLDDIAVPSFGLRYGVTSKLSVSAYRSPSLIGRPIELMVAYNFLDENDKQPFNAAVRFSVDGQNDFSRNFTENFELVLSRSITHHAQIYAVPTVSIHNRPLMGNTGLVTGPPPFQPCSAPLASGVPTNLNVRPCANTFSLGVAAAVDIRPTVALVVETIPTLANGTDLGIHRPAYAFGIQKKIWRHAFTFGFTNSPGTTVSQRAGTRATFLGSPTADKPSGMFVGFDLTRQVY
jgi:uncharacterized beta barrel domain-containing protein DUF5777